MNKKNGGNYFRLKAFFIMYWLSGSVAFASPVVVHAGNVYSGILGLAIESTDYDVTFHYGSYISIFEVLSPKYLNNQSLLMTLHARFKLQ